MATFSSCWLQFNHNLYFVAIFKILLSFLLDEDILTVKLREGKPNFLEGCKRKSLACRGCGKDLQTGCSKI